MEFTLKELIFGAVFVYLLYKYLTKNFDFWKKRGIKEMSPVPILGSNYKSVFRMADALQCSLDFYDTFKDERFGGIFMGTTPFLVVKDPELLKHIMVKDAEYFLNRHDWSLGTDPLMSNNLVGLKDEKWRKMRAVMTTVFTSAKMKDMFGFMEKCAEQGIKYLDDKIKSNKSDGQAVELEIKDFFSRYGTDVIGSTAFGFEVNSFIDKDNEFFKSGEIIRNAFSGLNIFKMILITTLPSVAKALNLTFFGEKYNNFFISLISNAIKEREEKNIVRKDVIHILMQARKGKAVGEDGEYVKGKLPDLTDLDIAAQAIVFFFGGFETIATLLGFAAYELAVNPDIQEKLQQEIDEVIESENGVSYEGVIHKMKYLDMIINETLRKWPPALLTDRMVTKKYVIPKTENSDEMVLEVGDRIWIPISGLQYDAKYFPNPKKFDPERFRDEKNTVKPFTFLAFGEGIRHCIGMRYALMEAKIILVEVLRRFSFVPSKQTPIPMKLSKKRGFQLVPDNGFYLGVKPRH